MTERNDKYLTERLAALDALQQYIDDYVKDYEWDAGSDGYHEPTEEERVLIEDAIAGLLGDYDFLAKMDAWRALCGTTPSAVSERNAFWEGYAEALNDLKTTNSHAPLSPFDKRAADRMAAIVDEMIYAGHLDSRSQLSDARLDYGQPFTDPDERRSIIDGHRTKSARPSTK